MSDEEERVSQEDFCDEVSSQIDEEEHEEEHGDEEAEGGDGEQKAGTADDMAGTLGGEIDVDTFDELRLDEATVEAAQNAWNTFIAQAASRDAAGDALFAAVCDAAPFLPGMFTAPPAIQAIKLLNGLNTFVTSLADPTALRMAVETLGFGHLALDVTVPRVAIFRDAILDLFQIELNAKLTSEGYAGLRAMLNYVGGALIYVKTNYAERIRILGDSWELCSGKREEKEKQDAADAAALAANADMIAGRNKKPDKKSLDTSSEKGGTEPASMVQKVPTTFSEMFQFNAAVMGFGTSLWMNEVLACFDGIVSNVADSGRVMEECDILVCRIAKVSTGRVALSDFKVCMLASLRSLLPKDWTTGHEVAWSWLWEIVERLVYKNMGMPQLWEKAYGDALEGIDEATGFQMRKDIYLKFFAVCPAGQDYFKQSNTYLHMIATKVMVTVLDMYREPVRMVDNISALGLRHVGYAIPTEFLPLFANCWVEVMRGISNDPVCIEGFQWSIGIISKKLIRTILEGSTIVMKAIIYNSKQSLNKAVAIAPRGERANWMLLVQVGTQKISPLAWAIESGALESASAMINDLLVIRADRDNYYYGLDFMFKRHWNIVQMCCDQAPGLLPDLFSGLIWRSRATFNGYRRVNYYIKHLMVSADGHFAKALEWVAELDDPGLVCHPTLVILSDLVWNKVASQSFLFRKSWFLLNILVFVFSQSVVHNMREGANGEIERIIVFCCRAFIYIFCLGNMLFQHLSRAIKDYRTGDTFKLLCLPIPNYMLNWQECATLILSALLIAMLSTEPILHCMGRDKGKLFTEACGQGKAKEFFHYGVISASAVAVFYMLLIDMAVFNNKVAAYVLVTGRMLSEVALFLLALAGVIFMFASSLSCLYQSSEDFHGIPNGGQALVEMVMQMYSTDSYKELQDEPVVYFGVMVFLIISVVFLLNMLIAQLSCAYGAIYTDMVGYARLKRIRIVNETMPHVPVKRWIKFLVSLKLDEPIEFNEGDVGVVGGVALQEPANANPTTEDRIRRYGGSTSKTIQWPEEDLAADAEADRFDRLEKMIGKAMARLTQGKEKKRKGALASSAGASISGTSGGEEGSSAKDEDEED